MIVDGAGFLAFSSEDYVDGHRPSGTVLLRSIARTYGAQAVGIVLTGMGTDGAAGLLSLRSAGGQTIAQDEATSVVYDMPRVSTTIGAAQDILSLERIVAHLLSMIP
jgi:two-component system chemotaxis response regulator CheB